MVEFKDRIEELNKTPATPVMCSHCGSYALAEMSGTPFCLKCLVSAVHKADSAEKIEIVPLGESRLRADDGGDNS